MEREAETIRRPSNIRFGIILSYVSLAIGILSNIFYTPFLLSHVGDRQYGIYSFVLSITSWFNIFTFALNDSYIKIASEHDQDPNNKGLINTLYIKLLFLISLGILFVSTVLFVLFKFDIIPLTKYDSSEKNILLIIFVMSSLSISISTILTLFKLFLHYKEKFILIKSIALIEQLSSLGISVAAILLGANIVIVALIKMSETAVFLFIIFLIAKFHFKIDFKKTKLSENKGLVKYIVYFCSFMLLGTIIGEINSSADKILLGFMAGAEYVSIYQLAFTFPSLFGQLSTAINAVFVPKINELRNNNREDELKDTYLKISLIQTVILFLIFGGFISCGKEFVKMWVGEERIVVYYIATVLIGVDTYYFCSYSAVSIEVAYFKQKIPCLIELIIMILNVVITAILLGVLGIEYAYMSCLIGTAFAKILGKWIIIPNYDKRALNLPIGKFRISFFTYFLFSVAIAAIIILISEFTGIKDLHHVLRFIIKGCLFAVCYFAFVIIKKDYKVFKKKHFDQFTS